MREGRRWTLITECGSFSVCVYFKYVNSSKKWFLFVKIFWKSFIHFKGIVLIDFVCKLQVRKSILYDYDIIIQLLFFDLPWIWILFTLYLMNVSVSAKNHVFWLIGGYWTSSGKYWLHVQDQNKLTIIVIGRSCKRGYPGWRSGKLKLSQKHEGILDRDRWITVIKALLLCSLCVFVFVLYLICSVCTDLIVMDGFPISFDFLTFFSSW